MAESLRGHSTGWRSAEPGDTAAEPQRSEAAVRSTTIAIDHADLPCGAAAAAVALGRLADELSGARYTLLDEIGRGGGGSVVLGFDRKLGRRIAVKRPIASGGAARLEREALVMARLEHPAIVPVHDAGRDADGTPFYAMKLLTGPNLGERIARAPRRSLPAPRLGSLTRRRSASASACRPGDARTWP